MKTKKGPYLLLTILMIIVALVAGVQLGRQVEQTNKAINYLLSVTPRPPTAAPTPKLPEKYLTYKQSQCGLQFLYPDTLTIVRETTTSAEFAINKQPALYLDCGKDAMLHVTSYMLQGKVATQEAQFQNQNIKITLTTLDKGNKQLFFSIINTQSGKTIWMTIREYLYPLLEKTVEFIP